MFMGGYKTRTLAPPSDTQVGRVQGVSKVRSDFYSLKFY